MEIILEIIDMEFYPGEIDLIMEEAVLLCPAMKRNRSELHPINAKRALPDVCYDDYHAYLVAMLLNSLVALC